MKKSELHILPSIWCGILFILLCILHTDISYASDIHKIFKHYSKSDGLSSNYVRNLIEDDKGYIWLFTSRGINRFDGYTFKEFFLDANATTGGLATDSKGRLWAGANTGLYYFDDEMQEFIGVNSFQNKDMSAIKVDSSDRIWVLRQDTLFVVNPDFTTRAYPYSTGGQVQAFCVTHDDEIWIADLTGHLCHLKQDTGTFEVYYAFPDQKGQISNKIYLLKQSVYSDDLFLFYEADDAMVFDMSTHLFRNLNVRNAFDTSYMLRDITEVSSDQFWIATNTDILIYTKSTGIWERIRYVPSESFGHKNYTIENILIDRKHGVWIGTQNGLSYLSLNDALDVFYPSESENSIRENIVSGIETDENGSTLWITLQEGVIYKYDIGQEKITSLARHHDNALGGMAPIGLAIKDNDLWVGSMIYGVELIDSKTGRHRKHFNLRKDSTDNIRHFRSVKVLDDGITLCLTDHGLFRYDESEGNFLLISNDALPAVAEIMVDSYENRLWAGLNYCNLDEIRTSDSVSFSRFDIPGFTDEDYSRIVEFSKDRDGNMWILHSRKGLMKYTPKTRELTVWNTSDILNRATSRRLYYDKVNDAIWVSTSQGIFVLSLKTLSQSVFNESTGLASDEFTRALSVDSDGRIYFGTTKGFIRINPSKLLLRENESSALRLTSAWNQSDDERIAVKESQDGIIAITTSYKHPTVSLNFSTLEYSNQKATTYSYKFNNSDWISLGKQNTILLTQLPSGKYDLWVKATDMYGRVCGNEPMHLNVIITPPWWNTIAAHTTYTIVILGLLFSAVLFIRRRQKEKAVYQMTLFENEKNKELYQEKINFFINIAHELRTPLTLMKIPLERLIKYSKICERGFQSLLTIENNNMRMIDLVNQIMAFKGLEDVNGEQLMNYVQTDIGEFLNKSIHLFSEAAANRHLQVIFNRSEQPIYAMVDEEAFTKIVNNLFSNAIKYSESHINIQLTEDGKGNIVLRFSNDGMPIPSPDRKKVFEPFYRSINQTGIQGTGLGLALTKHLVSSHQGTIEVVDANNGDTCFEVILPQVHEANMYASEIGKFNQPDEMPAPVVQHPSNGYTILVVDDNKEMLDMLSNELRVEYNVIKAQNGKEALDMFNDYSMALVISDIMMPVMDGYDFLRELKSNPRYNHIPVILLTSKANVKDRLMGLEIGADAYLDKPFSIEVLKAQINNLISGRERLREYYNSSPTANVRNLAYSKSDELFLDKLNEIINENISNVNFDVNTIADKFCMSRPTLYRKINAVSNLSPNDLIKSARLKLAAELLSTGNYKVYEIAEKVGFRSQSYFWSAFIKHYGISPSKYAKMSQSTIKTSEDNA